MGGAKRLEGWVGRSEGFAMERGRGCQRCRAGVEKGGSGKLRKGVLEPHAVIVKFIRLFGERPPDDVVASYCREFKSVLIDSDRAFDRRGDAEDISFHYFRRVRIF